MSLLDRLHDLLRRQKPDVLDLDAPDLRVVTESFNPIEADSAVLARSPNWRADEPAVLRHHLLLPADRVTEAAATLAQDHWTLREVAGDSGPAEPVDSVQVREKAENRHLVRLHALRVQRLDALHCAQERARMAGLAQRLDGESLGWDALQPKTPG
ncbi:hypothetical protein [Amycolatopsis nigrescens]|uniref:hypothetical protein n=1 Tax=Amycolatopsis nigrescens TaxID=381445 RepID=UPI00037C7E53|nr:hypothetical protein [Amycolatopsis nigrescens]